MLKTFFLFFFLLLTPAVLRAIAKLFELNPSTLFHWVKKLALLIADLSTLKPARKVVMDETKFRRRGETVYVWLALELERRKVLEVMVTRKRGIQETSELYTEDRAEKVRDTDRQGTMLQVPGEKGVCKP